MGRFFLVLISLLTLTGCSTVSVIPGSSITISGDNGGLVRKYRAKYAAWAENGVTVRITGVCFSACTLVTIYVPCERICITPQAVLGFHAVRNPDGKETAASSVENMELTFSYPHQISSWIMEHGGGTLTAKEIFMRYEDLQKVYRTCKP